MVTPFSSVKVVVVVELPSGRITEYIVLLLLMGLPLPSVMKPEGEPFPLLELLNSVENAVSSQLLLESPLFAAVEEGFAA